MFHAERKQIGGSGHEEEIGNFKDSLVSKTRPGYRTFSHSFSAEIPSTLFSPTEVAIARAALEGEVDGTPSRLDKAGVGLGSPWLLAGRVAGDTGLVKESICGDDVSNKEYTLTWPNLCL